MLMGNIVWWKLCEVYYSWDMSCFLFGGVLFWWIYLALKESRKNNWKPRKVRGVKKTLQLYKIYKFSPDQITEN